MFGRVCSGLVFLTLISLGAAEYAYIEETNTHQLDMDSFWNMAHKIEKHVIIELYTSASWCSKYIFLIARSALMVQFHLKNVCQYLTTFKWKKKLEFGHKIISTILLFLRPWFWNSRSYLVFFPFFIVSFQGTLNFSWKGLRIIMYNSWN